MSQEPLKVEHGEGVLTITREVFGQEQEEQRTVRVRPFLGNATPGFVTVRLGRTINTGNYSSARIDVAFTVPGYREELPELYHDVVALVSDIMDDEVSKIELGCGLSARRSDEAVDAVL